MNAEQRKVIGMTREYPVDQEKVAAREPIHPGVIFGEEVMPELRKKRTVGEIASLLGVSRQTLHRVMAGDIAVSPRWLRAPLPTSLPIRAAHRGADCYVAGHDAMKGLRLTPSSDAISPTVRFFRSSGITSSPKITPG